MTNVELLKAIKERLAEMHHEGCNVRLSSIVCGHCNCGESVRHKQIMKELMKRLLVVRGDLRRTR